MGPRRLLIAAIVLGVAGGAAWLAVPARFMVDGVSMGPALLPGDVVRTGPFPALDQLRQPRRFERWVLAAADGLALKRVVGLPGEDVSLAGGDLVIDGAVVLKSPRLLAEIGSIVPDTTAAVPPAAQAADWAWSHAGAEILDDAPFDADATRTLAAVGDAGFAALVDVREASTTRPATVRLLVDATVFTQSLTDPGRHAVVAGRLDGRLVVAAWRVPGGDGRTGSRSCLPAGPPEAWQIADPYPEPFAVDAAPALAIGGSDDRVRVVRVTRWRDVAWRPGADGRDSWILGADEIFVLGDHPAASTDSRRWGPVRTRALRHRIVTR